MSFYALTAEASHMHWGHFDRTLAPRLTAASGDIVQIETVTTCAMAYPEGMMDDAVRAIYRAPLRRGPGPHLLTGPVAIAGAEPGDALEVRVLSLSPRLPYGLCAQLPFGLLPEVTPALATVFKADLERHTATGCFSFEVPVPKPPAGDPWHVTYRPCPSELCVPLRPHLGIAGVAPDREGPVSTVAPGPFGGNVDQWRFGPATSMLYPVLVPGALFSCGDGHLAQGDGEVTGNGIEAHLDATVQFILHKGRTLEGPILQTPDAWIVHAFAPTLDEACTRAGEQALRFLAGFGLSRPDAYTLLSVAGDFGITQVVDREKGVHVILKKACLPRRAGRPPGPAQQ